MFLWWLDALQVLLSNVLLFQPPLLVEFGHAVVAKATIEL